MNLETKPTQGPDPGARLNIQGPEKVGDKIAQFKLEGRLDIFTYRSLSEKIKALRAEDPRTWLIVDLSKVEFVASSGWSVLLVTANKLAKQGAKLVLTGMAEDLDRVYQTMQMPLVALSFPTPEDARRSLSSAGAGA